MLKTRALQVFRKPPQKFNCAQAIAFGAGREDLLDEMKNCGGGNAPRGLCGALHCAMQIAGEKAAPAVAEAFEKKFGFVRCHDLKKIAHAPCEDCVSCAADALCGATQQPR